MLHRSVLCLFFCSTNNPKYRNLVCNPKTQWITSCFCFGCYKVTESFIVKVVSSWLFYKHPNFFDKINDVFMNVCN